MAQRSGPLSPGVSRAARQNWMVWPLRGFFTGSCIQTVWATPDRDSTSSSDRSSSSSRGRFSPSSRSRTAWAV